MNNEHTQRTAWDIVYLITCALHDKIPSAEKVQNMDLEQLYQITENHMLTAIVTMALESLWAVSPPEDRSTPDLWREAKGKAIRKNLLLDTERAQLLEQFEKEGIWYMPLKGCLLKDIYPKFGMRQMADNDILFDAEYREKVHELMLQRGYEAEEYGESNHDVYMKQPIYNFEMHTDFFAESSSEIWYQYYSNVKERLLPDAKKRYGFHFNDEDFYIYVTTHACQHFRTRGTGIRTLLDSYVYLRQKGDSLDWGYIRTELEKLGIAEFEEKSRILAERLFSENAATEEGELTEEQKEMFYYCLTSGVHGSKENRVVNDLKAMQADEHPLTLKTKLHYYGKRFFQKPENVKYKWTIPFCWLWRVIRMPFTKPREIMQEVKTVWKAGKDK